MNQVLDKYISDYQNAIKLLNKKENLETTIEKLREDKRAQLSTFDGVIRGITEYETKQANLQKLANLVEQKREKVNKRKKHIEDYQKSCEVKIQRLQHHLKIIQAFEKELKNECVIWEKKCKEINMLEIVFMSRKRIMLFELGSLILNESLAKYLFGGFYELHKIFSERSKDKEIAKISPVIDINLSPANKEDEISTGLGYTALLLNCLSKYLNVPLIYPMYFRGSRSLIMKRLNEDFPIYVTKLYDDKIFDKALRHLVQNFIQILDYFGIDNKHKRPKFRRIMEILIKVMYDGYL